MSYNISRVIVHKMQATMSPNDLLSLLSRFGGRLPESNFLQDHKEAARAALARGQDSVELKSFNWCEDFSGRTFEVLKDTIASFITGTVEVVLVWERGDTITGLLIKDGTCRACGVEVTPVYPQGWEISAAPVTAH